jgi:hypothetical protein
VTLDTKLQPFAEQRQSGGGAAELSRLQRRQEAELREQRTSLLAKITELEASVDSVEAINYSSAVAEQQLEGQEGEGEKEEEQQQQQVEPLEQADPVWAEAGRKASRQPPAAAPRRLRVQARRVAAPPRSQRQPAHGTASSGERRRLLIGSSSTDGEKAGLERDAATNECRPMGSDGVERVAQQLEVAIDAQVCSAAAACEAEGLCGTHVAPSVCAHALIHVCVRTDGTGPVRSGRAVCVLER